MNSASKPMSGSVSKHRKLYTNHIIVIYSENTGDKNIGSVFFRL